MIDIFFFLLEIYRTIASYIVGCQREARQRNAKAKKILSGELNTTHGPRPSRKRITSFRNSASSAFRTN